MSQEMIPLFDIKAQNESLKEELYEAFRLVQESSAFILGQHVERLEDAIAAHVGGGARVVGVGSGTDALLLSLMAHGIGPGDEVITTAHSFLATGNAIIRAGAKLVFCDIHPETFNLDIRLLSGLVTERTKAVIPVHLMGRPVDDRAFSTEADLHGLRVIGDAAQAFSGSVQDIHPDDPWVPVGRLFETECFSTFPTKPLGGLGDGGFVVTRDREIESRIRAMRQQGCEVKFVGKYVGLNSRLDALQAAFLLRKLPHQAEWRKQRENVALRYGLAFNGLPLRCQTWHPGHAWHCFGMILESEAIRDALREHLKVRKIASVVHYPVPMCQQPSFGEHRVSCPETEKACRQGLSIPIYAEMTSEQIEWVIQGVVSFFEL